MKRIILNFMAGSLVALAAVFAGCQGEFDGGSGKGVATGTQISEAKKFFAEAYAKQTEGIVILSGFVKSTFDPGEFTPLWENTTSSSDAVAEHLLVPIIADYSYEGSFFINPGTTDTLNYITSVFQKLAIITDKASGDMEGYVVSIVPSKAYWDKHGLIVGDRFSHFGSDFDGMVFYTSLNGLDIVKLEKYTKGKLTKTIHADLTRTNVRGRYEELYSTSGLLGVARSLRIGTRSGENATFAFGFSSSMPMQGTANGCAVTVGYWAYSQYGNPGSFSDYTTGWEYFYENGIQPGTEFEGFLGYQFDYTNFSAGTLKSTIDSGRIIIAALEDHVVAIVGYKGSSVIYLDPADGGMYASNSLVIYEGYVINGLN